MQLDLGLPNVVGVHLSDLEVFVLSIYRPPSYSEEENRLLIEFLTEFSATHELFVLGDFNLPSISWSVEGGNTSRLPPVDRAFSDCLAWCSGSTLGHFSLLVTPWI